MILRLPAGKSIVRPRSACPACGAAIAWHDNVPVLSWVLLRGKCRACRARISPRYALVEVLAGGLFVLAAWRLVLAPGDLRDPAAYLRLAVVLVLLSALVALAFIDIDHRLLPDRITKPGILAGPILVGVLAPGLLLGRDDPVPGFLGDLPPNGAALLLAVAGGIVGWGVIRLVAWAGEKALRREAMGLGDAKLLGMIGGFVGPVGVLLVLVIASFLGSAVGLLRLLVTRDREIPFGPFLAAGGAAMVLFPREIHEALRAILVRG